jgi:Domain of unknown function (DUF4396)
MPPQWLTVVAWVALAAAAAGVADILVDVFGRGHRQRMWVMEVVWPVTALYAPGLANVAYRRWGRPRSPRWRREHGAPADDETPMPVATALGVTHCGTGCTLGDIAGAVIVFLLAWELAGRSLWPEYIVNFGLAFALGIVFQYLTIAPMRGLGVRKGLVAALKADTFSLVAFEIGMFGWMALVQLVWFSSSGLHPDHAAYWFLMQVGMLLGFMTAYPVNWWLLRRGLKEAM